MAGHACDQKKLLFSFQFPFDILTLSAISLCRQPAAQREFSEKEKACGRRKGVDLRKRLEEAKCKIVSFGEAQTYFLLSFPFNGRDDFGDTNATC